MNDRLATPTQTDASGWKILIVVMALVVALVSAIAIGSSAMRGRDPYVAGVLSLEGDPQRGAAIFQMNCAGCHGPQGKGNVGPAIVDIAERRSRSSIIRQVIEGNTPPMPQFQPSPETMADLLAYLEML